MIHILKEMLNILGLSSLGENIWGGFKCPARKIWVLLELNLSFHI